MDRLHIWDFVSQEDLLRYWNNLQETFHTSWPLFGLITAMVIMLIAAIWKDRRDMGKVMPRLRGSWRTRRLIEDILCNGLENAYHQGQITKKMKRRLYHNLADVLELPGLRPRYHGVRKIWPATAEKLKKLIRLRLGNKNPLPIPTAEPKRGETLSILARHHKAA